MGAVLGVWTHITKLYMWLQILVTQHCKGQRQGLAACETSSRFSERPCHKGEEGGVGEQNV